MKKVYSLSLALSLSILLAMAANPVLAGEAAAVALLQQMRSPEVKNAELAILVGSWKGRGTVKPSRKFSKMKVKCNLINSWIMDGKLLKQSMSCKSFLMTVKRTTYMGFDKATGKITGRSFGNFGPNNASINGSAKNGSFDLLMRHAKKSGSGTVQNRLLTSMSGPNSMRSIMTKVSKRPYDVMRIEYRRSGNKTYL